MKERAYRSPSIAILGFALLVFLAGLAAADERAVRATSASREAAFAAVLPAQASCRPCAVAHANCFANCFGLPEKEGMRACLTACDNAVATCTCDEAVTLRSEELVEWEWPSLSKAACHSTTPCGSAYASCAGWSSYADCGDLFCGTGMGCGSNCNPFKPCFGPALQQWRERFRVCFNEFGQSCTEWQRVVLTYECGC